MSSNNTTITHKGRIIDITPEITTVEIISESACGSCHAKNLCSLSESKTKNIKVPTRGWDQFQPGDEVDVVLKASMGLKAVWIGYVIPLFVLVAVLLILLQTGRTELFSGLAAIVAVAVYYLAIWIFRGKLQNEITFSIKK
ncbi:MAG: SoxR reducing system RseC family protein [Bacteroidales bacterium]|nr:SoxR reducing system RseC family protein [Bacteroidales bacterium]